jgi:transcriptional regulator with XRE-family HTH domain
MTLSLKTTSLWSKAVIIGDRLRILREARQLSERDVEESTGVPGSYLLRIETGHAVPSFEVLEKLAAALGVVPRDLFYEGEQPPELQNLPKRLSADEIVRATQVKS